MPLKASEGGKKRIHKGAARLYANPSTYNREGKKKRGRGGREKKGTVKGGRCDSFSLRLHPSVIECQRKKEGGKKEKEKKNKKLQRKKEREKGIDS